MYKDIWYLPKGDSWAARFIEDANGEYLWRDSKGTGSIALNIESVLEKGQNADFWIAPGRALGRQGRLGHVWNAREEDPRRGVWER